MITQSMKCATPECGKLTKFIVFWPGKIPPPRYCELCTPIVVENIKMAGIDDVKFRKLGPGE